MVNPFVPFNIECNDFRLCANTLMVIEDIKNQPSLFLFPFSISYPFESLEDTLPLSNKTLF